MSISSGLQFSQILRLAVGSHVRSTTGGTPVTKKGADRDAALSVLLQEALTCGFLLVFSVGKAQLGFLEVTHLCLAMD